MSDDKEQSAADVSESIRKAAHDDVSNEGRGGRGEKRMMGGGFGRKKACRICTDSEFLLDYKNIRVLQSFLSEHGKLVPRRISGNCAFHQRAMTTALKQARQLALVGYITPGY
ncbi:MAG TPA: 30S ribosomal protein S18 [Bdellovibrionota bacterium]|nr:30S ribosomal protein S18 [Bdellovibrionota bacterium]